MGAVKGLRDHIAGVSNVGGLEKNDFGFFVRCRAVLNVAWHHGQLTGAELDNPVTILDAESAAPDEEHFLDIVVMVPGKLALHFHELHFLSIERCDHLRTPVLAEFGEFLRDADFVHVLSSPTSSVTLA